MSEQHTLGQTSSIGAAWPPRVDTTHNRLRGFYTEGVVRTAEDARGFAAEFRGAQRAMEQHPGIDRLTIRVIAQAGTLATLEAMGVRVEAALPLARTEPGLVIAYTAANDPGRTMSPAHLARHQSVLRQTVQRPRQTHDPEASLRAQDFTPHVIDPANANQLTPRFLDLYAAFDYDAADVSELLSNPDNTIAYVEDGDRIVSTALAESGRVSVDGVGEINLVEITDASTDPAYRGRGLYKNVSGYLANQLLRGRSDLHALYGESNLAMRGVLFAAHENGRQFSHLDNYGINRPDFGILEQNFHVADGVETRPYNDFALSYYPLT